MWFLLRVVLSWTSVILVQATEKTAVCVTEHFRGVDITCLAGGVLHIQDVFWGAHNGSQSACHYLPGDCTSIVYDFQKIIADCSGLSVCSYRTTVPTILTCADGTKKVTRYFQFDYECVFKNSTLDICSEGNLQLSEGHIMSTGYPDFPRATSGDCSCVITSEVISHVNLTIIDLSTDNENLALMNPCYVKLILNEHYQSCRGNMANWNEAVNHDVTDTSLYVRVVIKSGVKGKFWLKYTSNVTKRLTVCCGQRSTSSPKCHSTTTLTLAQLSSSSVTTSEDVTSDRDMLSTDLSTTANKPVSNNHTPSLLVSSLEDMTSARVSSSYITTAANLSNPPLSSYETTSSASHVQQDVLIYSVTAGCAAVLIFIVTIVIICICLRKKRLKAKETIYSSPVQATDSDSHNDVTQRSFNNPVFVDNEADPMCQETNVKQSDKLQLMNELTDKFDKTSLSEDGNEDNPVYYNTAKQIQKTTLSRCSVRQNNSTEQTQDTTKPDMFYQEMHHHGTVNGKTNQQDSSSENMNQLPDGVHTSQTMAGANVYDDVSEDTIPKETARKTTHSEISDSGGAGKTIVSTGSLKNMDRFRGDQKATVFHSNVYDDVRDNSTSATENETTENETASTTYSEIRETDAGPVISKSVITGYSANQNFNDADFHNHFVGNTCFSSSNLYEEIKDDNIEVDSRIAMYSEVREPDISCNKIKSSDARPEINPQVHMVKETGASSLNLYEGIKEDDELQPKISNKEINDLPSATNFAPQYSECEDVTQAMKYTIGDSVYSECNPAPRSLKLSKSTSLYEEYGDPSTTGQVQETGMKNWVCSTAVYTSPDKTKKTSEDQLSREKKSDDSNENNGNINIDNLDAKPHKKSYSKKGSENINIADLYAKPEKKTKSKSVGFMESYKEISSNQDPPLQQENLLDNEKDVSALYAKPDMGNNIPSRERKDQRVQGSLGGAVDEEIGQSKSFGIEDEATGNERTGVEALYAKPDKSTKQTDIRNEALRRDVTKKTPGTGKPELAPKPPNHKTKSTIFHIV